MLAAFAVAPINKDKVKDRKIFFICPAYILYVLNFNIKELKKKMVNVELAKFRGYGGTGRRAALRMLWSNP